MRPGYVPRKPLRGYIIYETNITPSYFLKGSGELEAAINRITIHSPSEGEIVLKYHWIEGLKTDPPLEIGSVKVLDDPVGFIRLRNTSGAKKIEIFR